jgi:hypothetical protein
MSKTFIQAELSPELVNLARRFVSQSGQTDLNGLLEQALQDFFKHHASEIPDGKAQANRHEVFQALAAQAEAAAKTLMLQQVRPLFLFAAVSRGLCRPQLFRVVCLWLQQH